MTHLSRVSARAPLHSVLLIALLLAAVLWFPARAEPPAPALPAPQPDPAFYAYDNARPVDAAEGPYAAPETKLPPDPRVAVTTVTFPSPVQTPFPVDNTVTGYLFMPKTPGRHPAMLVMHEWLPKNLDLEFRVCRSLADNDIAAFLMVQPFSLNRRPKPGRPDAELLSADVPEMVGAMRQGVIDARRSLDYLSQRPDIDPERLGVSGISIGAVVAGLIAGVDRRAKIVVEIAGGADVADIIYGSPFLRGLQDEMRLRGVTIDDLHREMAQIEPALWLKGFDPRNGLIFSGRYDVFIKPWQAVDLSKAMNGAPIVWTNTGHFGLDFAEKRVRDEGVKFVRARFFPPDEAGPTPLAPSSLPAAHSLTPAYVPPRMIPAPTIKLGILAGGREGLSPALAYQAIDFDKAGRYSLDGQVTLQGLSLGLSARTGLGTSLGLEAPLFHGAVKVRPYVLFSFAL